MENSPKRPCILGTPNSSDILKLSHLILLLIILFLMWKSKHFLILFHFLAGFVQFIESTPVAEVLDKDEDRSIQV